MLVKNEKSNVIHVAGKFIGPGVNKLEHAWWAKARQHPTIKAKLESGQLIEETSFESMEQAEALGESMDQTVIDHITTLSVNHAKQLINDTVDAGLLEAWQKRDDRRGVQVLLAKQLEKVKAEPIYRDRSQSRQVVTGKGPEIVNLAANPGAQDD